MNAAVVYLGSSSSTLRAGPSPSAQAVSGGCGSSFARGGSIGVPLGPARAASTVGVGIKRGPQRFALQCRGTGRGEGTEAEQERIIRASSHMNASGPGARGEGEAAPAGGGAGAGGKKLACLLGGVALAAGLRAVTAPHAHGRVAKEPPITYACLQVNGAPAARRRVDDGFLTGYGSGRARRSGSPVVYPALNVIRGDSATALLSCSVAGGRSGVEVPAMVSSTRAEPEDASAAAPERGTSSGRGGEGGNLLYVVAASEEGQTDAQRKVLAQKFAAFLGEVREEALKQGVSARTVDQALRSCKAPEPKIITHEYNQPEIKQTLAAYLDVRVPTRVARGRELLAEEQSLLQKVEDNYGVPSEILVAIWGLESNFGKFQGNWATVPALATLSFDATSGGRMAFFRSELIAAMKLVDGGKVKFSDLKGSWAGALGQCQFMPSNYSRLAVDWDGDGKADIWGSRADALASMANFLRENGWAAGQPYGRAAQCPKGISAKETGLGTERTVEEWLRRGVKYAGGGPPLPPKAMASLVAPDGADGPAFLACANFRKIMRYNPSTWYAVSVGSLANAIYTASV